MSAIIPFEGAPLPAYLKQEAKQLNDDLLSHAGKGFPIISIKGKTFAVVRDGERKIMRNPLDPASPATSIDVVVVKANKGLSKNYYVGGYKEGSKEKPTCWSGDGVAPDRRVEKPQSKHCATCPQNQWGSKISDDGRKVKACQDTVRIAVAAPAQINDPYLMRVPPASIRALGEYGQLLQKRGVGYNMVVTNIGFDIEKPTPLLVFKPVGFLPEDLYQQVKEVAESETVKSIIGMNGDPIVEADIEEAAASPAPEPVVVHNVVIPAPAATTAVQPTKSKTVTVDEVQAAIAKAAGVVPGAPGPINALPAAKPAATTDDPTLTVAMSEFKFDD